MPYLGIRIFLLNPRGSLALSKWKELKWVYVICRIGSAVFQKENEKRCTHYIRQNWRILNNADKLCITPITNNMDSYSVLYLCRWSTSLYRNACSGSLRTAFYQCPCKLSCISCEMTRLFAWQYSLLFVVVCYLKQFLFKKCE